MKENINTFGLFNVVSLIKLIIKRKVFFLILIIVSALISIFISSPLFIKPLYKSEAIIYSSNMKPTSEESPTELMLQYLESNAIKDSVVKINNLAEHWDIKNNHPNYNYIVDKTFDEYISFKETRFESVKIEVLDKDPQIAFNIVNSILFYFNQTVEKNRKEKFTEVYKSYKFYEKIKIDYMDSLKKRSDFIKKEYGVYDYKSTSRELIEGLLGTVDGSDKINHKNVQILKNNFAIYGTEMLLIEKIIEYETENSIIFRNRNIEESIFEINRNIKHYELITSPKVSDKKAYPVRWLIVLSGVIGSFMTFVLFFLFFDNRDYFKNLFKK